MVRPTWDEVWLDTAHVIAERSLCVRRRVGAIIVTTENRPVSSGYNGPPAGLEYKISCADFCSRATNKTPDYNNCVAIHAEANALLFASRSQYEGGTIYVTHLCCFDCAKLIANSGLARVVIRFQNSNRDITQMLNLLTASGLQVEIEEKIQ